RSLKPACLQGYRGFESHPFRQIVRDALFKTRCPKGDAGQIESPLRALTSYRPHWRAKSWRRVSDYRPQFNFVRCVVATISLSQRRLGQSFGPVALSSQYRVCSSVQPGTAATVRRWPEHKWPSCRLERNTVAASAEVHKVINRP